MHTEFGLADPRLHSAAVLQKLQKREVTHLVRVCDPSYDTAIITAAGIEVHDWPYPDGDPPPEEVISSFLELCATAFGDESGCIAVHCVAGLGRWGPLALHIQRAGA